MNLFLGILEFVLIVVLAGLSFLFLLIIIILTLKAYSVLLDVLGFKTYAEKLNAWSEKIVEYTDKMV